MSFLNLTDEEVAKCYERLNSGEAIVLIQPSKDKADPGIVLFIDGYKVDVHSNYDEACDSLLWIKNGEANNK